MAVHQEMQRIFDDERRNPGEEGGPYTEIVLDDQGCPRLGCLIDPNACDNNPYERRLRVEDELGAFVALPSVWKALGVAYHDAGDD
jgi:hypothetical protein